MQDGHRVACCDSVRFWVFATIKRTELLALMDILIGLVVLGVIILVHEWGHFVVARLFGVRVDVFSIGFGPRVFGVKRGDTDWRFSALPLGGYVRMAGQDITDIDAGEQKPTGAPDELMSKTRWQRALISFAGPAVNLIFPVLLLGTYFVIAGEPYPAYLDKPVIVVGLPQTATSGLQVGDKIVALNGTKNPTWRDAYQVLGTATPGSTLKLQVEDLTGATKEVNIDYKNATDEYPAGLLSYRSQNSAGDSWTAGGSGGHQGWRRG